MAECERVCRYVDLPLQHASDTVLKRMRRPGTQASYERLLARIRRMVPGVSIRTTFIVGFPGETDADFDRLCAFVETQRFDQSGSSPTRTRKARRRASCRTTCRDG